MLIVVALDDISGETVAYAIEKLLEKGANNVHVSQTVTKKGRTGLLFFIDVNEEYLDEIYEIIMTELGSTGFNVIETKHYHTRNKVTEHKIIIKTKQKSINETIRITSSFSPKGNLVKIDPTPKDLIRIIQKTKQKLGITVTARVLKKIIKNETKTQHDEIIIELTHLEKS
jgi:uncharacterized protein (DUF111 family)